MKKTILVLILSSILNISFSQTKKLDKANVQFNQYNYKKALSYYLDLHKSEVSPYYVTLKIADCYRLTNNMYEAEHWYKEALKFPDVAPETSLYLGQILMQQGKQSEAIDYLKKYFEQGDFSYKEICSDYSTYLTFLSADSKRFNILNLPLNTKYSEYAPAILGSKLIFSSNRPSSSMIKRGDIRTNKPFYDIYEASISELSLIDKPKLSEPAFNSKYNDGPICFSNQQDIAFITRNDITSKSEQSQLNIVISKKLTNKWSEDVDKLSIGQKNSSFAHPFITKDLARLYFISNMPGGFGGMDIYYSEFKNGFLSTPVNLGAIINTPGNESFPFIANDSTLYFSSNGHPGLGGYDIYMAKSNNGLFNHVFNLGAPVNSELDDMGLTLNRDGKSGYFSSNRHSGKGEDDIYSVQLIKSLNFTKVSGSVTSTDQFPLKGTIITILDSDGHPFNELESNDNGQFSFYLPDTQNYTVTFKRRYFQNHERVINSSDLNQKELQIIVVLEKK